MLKKIAAFLFGLSLTGCGVHLPGQPTTPTMTYHADTSFTEPERQCLEVSAGIWRGQTSGLADIRFKYDFNTHSTKSVLENQLNDRLERWTSDNPEVKKYESDFEEGQFLLGFAEGKITNTIRTPIEVHLVMDRLRDPHMCQLTAIHEFGHAFGVPHLDNKVTNIMYPSVHPGRTACLKSDDLLAFSILNKVPSNLMIPCPDDPGLLVSEE